MWRLLTDPGRNPHPGELRRDLRHTITVIAVAAAIAFPCCAAAVTLVFLYASDIGGHALLTTSIWLTRAAQAAGAAAWGAAIRLWRRDRRRRKRG